MPRNIEVSQAQAAALLRDIQFALKSMTDEERENVYLFPSTPVGIAISFDSNYHPFIGQTSGLNTRSQRTHLRFDNPLLRQIADALEALGKEEKGGRVFLTSRGVYCKDGSQQVVLVRWNWPEGDLVGKVEKLYEQI